MKGSVFQEWFTDNGWKMQSIFVNGLRAPDSKTTAVKKVVRWMRTQACNNADPNKPDCYMSAPQMTRDLIEAACDECEYLTCHYVHHLADALRILALFHHSTETRLVPETDKQFITRHVDKVSAGVGLASSL